VLEEFKDIIAGLEQRIHLYKAKLQELQKKRERIEDDIKTTHKYLELAETLCKVEVGKGISPEQTGEREKRTSMEEGDLSKLILFEKTKYVGLSVPQATCLLLKEVGVSLHAKEIFRKLNEGGMRIGGKTPVTSISTSLSRDKRFRKVAPNTFKLVEEGAEELVAVSSAAMSHSLTS
jgi:hypothetical protein